MKKIIFVLGVALIGFGGVATQNSIANATDKSMDQEQTQKVERKKVNQRGVQHRGKQDQVNQSHMTAEQRVEKLDQEVQLSPDQKKRMVEVYKKSQSEATEARRSNRDSFEQERNNILTPEQRKLLEVKKEHNRKDMQRSTIDNSPEERTQRRQMMRNKK